MPMSAAQPLWSVNFATSVGAVPVPLAKFIFGGNSNIRQPRHLEHADD